MQKRLSLKKISTEQWVLFIGWGIFFFWVDHFARTHDLYWTFPWFDMAVHAIGGALIGIGMILVFRIKNRSVSIRNKWLTMFAVLLVITLGWEAKELLIGNPLFGTSIPLFNFADELTDVISGILGGLVAFAYLKQPS